MKSIPQRCTHNAEVEDSSSSLATKADLSINFDYVRFYFALNPLIYKGYSWLLFPLIAIILTIVTEPIILPIKF